MQGIPKAGWQQRWHPFWGQGLAHVHPVVGPFALADHRLPAANPAGLVSGNEIRTQPRRRDLNGLVQPWPQEGTSKSSLPAFPENELWERCPLRSKGATDWMVEKRAELEWWPEERIGALKNLDALASQLGKIIVATKPDGMLAYSKRNARQFSALGKKDFVSAGMYAYAAFLMWLQNGAYSSVAPEDEASFSGWSGSAGVSRLAEGQGRMRL